MESKISQELFSSGTLTPASKPFQVHDTRLKGFILRVQPSGEMTYYFEYRLSGRRNRIKIGTVKEIGPTVARDRAKEFSADIIRGIDPAAAKREARANTLTLENYLDQEYAPWAENEARFRSGKITVAAIRRSFAEFLKKPINDPTFGWCIEKYRTARMKSGIKKATVDREVGALKSMFSHAVRNPGVKLAENPLKNIKPLRKEGDDDEGDERVRYLGQYDANEGARFWAAVEARELRMREERRRFNEWRAARHLEPYPDLDAVPFADHLKPMIILSLNTGLRRKELFRSEWESFSAALSEPTLTVPGRIAKNKKTRHVTLNDTALQALLAWKKQTGVTTGLLFPGRTGLPMENIKKAWQKLLEDAQIVDFRWHDQRHDFASRLVMRGVELNMVRELLGHRDLKMTLRYAHLSPYSKAQAVRKLDDHGQGQGGHVPPQIGPGLGMSVSNGGEYATG